MPTLPPAVRQYGRLIAVSAVLAAFAVVLPTQLASADTQEWTYDARIDIATLPALHAPTPDAVDWDNDGDLDMVVGMGKTTQYGGIAVFLRDENGDLPAGPSASGPEAAPRPAECCPGTTDRS